MLFGSFFYTIKFLRSFSEIEIAAGALRFSHYIIYDILASWDKSCSKGSVLVKHNIDSALTL
jgi:hypothetical protein